MCRITRPSLFRTCSVRLAFCARHSRHSSPVCPLVLSLFLLTCYPYPYHTRFLASISTSRLKHSEVRREERVVSKCTAHRRDSSFAAARPTGPPSFLDPERPRLFSTLSKTRRWPPRPRREATRSGLRSRRARLQGPSKAPSPTLPTLSRRRSSSTASLAQRRAFPCLSLLYLARSIQLADMASCLQPPGPIDIVRTTVKERGLAGLYKGCGALVTGNAVKAGVRFLSYDYFKGLLQDSEVRLFSLVSSGRGWRGRC